MHTLQQLSPDHYSTSDTQQSAYEDDDFTYDDAFFDNNQPGPSYQRPGKTSNSTRPNLNSEPVLTFTNLDITSTNVSDVLPKIAEDDNATAALPPQSNPTLLTYQEGRQMLRELMLTSHLAAERLLEGAQSTIC